MFPGDSKIEMRDKRIAKNPRFYHDSGRKPLAFGIKWCYDEVELNSNTNAEVGRWSTFLCDIRKQNWEIRENVKSVSGRRVDE